VVWWLFYVECRKSFLVATWWLGSRVVWNRERSCFVCVGGLFACLRVDVDAKVPPRPEVAHGTLRKDIRVYTHLYAH